MQTSQNKRIGFDYNYSMETNTKADSKSGSNSENSDSDSDKDVVSLDAIQLNKNLKKTTQKKYKKK